jgi:hypothetical protein
MGCDINVHSIANALIEWEPIGEITGLADGSDSVNIEPSDDGQNTMQVSADGRSGTLSGNARTNGQCTVKLAVGSPFVDVLANVWQTNRFTRGTLTVTDVETNKSYAMECATLQNMPATAYGSEVADSVDFVFLYKSMTFTPGLSAVNAIAATF